MNVKSIFKGFLQKQQAPSPTDVLVGLLCVKIRADGKRIDEMQIPGYYGRFSWDWKDKGVSLRFTTIVYPKNSEAAWVDHMKHNGTEIDLSIEQEKHLLQALNEAHWLAVAKNTVDRLALTELKACDAIEAILK